MSTATVIQASELSNSAGLTNEHLTAVIQDLSKFGEIDAAAAQRVVRYVVDDVDDEVLLTVAGWSNAGETLSLAASPNHSGIVREIRKIFLQRADVLMPESLNEVPVDFWVRLFNVYETAVRASGLAFTAGSTWPSWVIVPYLELIECVSAIRVAKKTRPKWTLELFEAVLEKSGISSSVLVEGKFDPHNHMAQTSTFWLNSGKALNVFNTDEWKACMERHPEVVQRALAEKSTDLRVHALDVLHRYEYDWTRFADCVIQFATGSSKKVREQTLRLLTKRLDVAVPLIEKTLAEGSAAERNEAAALLWRLLKNDAAKTLLAHAEMETSDRVKQTIHKLTAAPTSEETAQFSYDLPPVEMETGELPLPEEVKQRIHDFFADANVKAMQHYEQQMQQYEASDNQYLYKPRKPAEVPAKQIRKAIEFIEGKCDIVEGVSDLRQYAWNQGILGDLLAPPTFKLIHVVRMAFAFGYLQFERGRELWWTQQQDLEAFRDRCETKFGLREVDAAVATLPGGKPGAAVRAYIQYNSQWNSFCDWEPEAVWPAFSEHLDILRKTLTPLSDRDTYSYDSLLTERRRNAFRVLAMFPELPPDFIPMLWEMALGEAKTDRPTAQAALASVPNKTEKVLVALKDGKQVVRTAAADWLGRLGDPSAVKPLIDAFRKEKHELAKGVMLSALDALGADLDEFINRKALLAEAEKGLAKGRPKGMEWVPLDSLPALHWEDTGDAVDPRITQWWVVQSIQQKSPVGSPLLRKLLSLCRPIDAEQLANFTLGVWIAHDTRTMSHEECAAKAQEDADRMWQAYGSHQYYQEHYGGKKENLYQERYRQYSTQCIGSAINEKGMLAFASAAGGRDCVKLAEQYIRKWFGNRMAQCKCLVEVLAWIDHPLAIQVLLSIANRFRTKGIRKAAQEHVESLADRRGWTLDELADRTIPDGGFERETDEDGKPVGDQAVLVLDYGPRKFNVILDDELTPVITRDDGKPVKSAPSPGKNDDPEKAKEAKKAFSEAKKTVKDVVKQQSERLFESLCTQRAWVLDDWRRYLLHHPIVGKLCNRLVWAVFAPIPKGASGRDVETPFLGCMRPLEDGSFTNEVDEEVDFPPEAIVRLAHTCNVSPELAEAWQQHLQDYDVQPLFAQFGRETFQLSDERKKETDVDDFQGHMLTTFKLRSKATKLGYVRGEAEDGGSFALYRKPFPSLQLQAVIEFTGSYLPEEDIPAALTSMYFISLKGNDERAYSWGSSKLRLGKVPPVLLSECYNDLKQIAAEGSGFDPEWEKKGLF